MTIERRVARLATIPPLKPGFVGPGHLASQIVAIEDFADNDPFLLLMDDHLDIGERPVGGAHPHAGFETVTLLLEGSIYDRDEGGVIDTGEVQWMTAGRGIVHGENVATRGRVRLLQLWLTLPKADRSALPSFQDIHHDAIPIRREPGITARVYSGASGSVSSATRNHVPTTIVEFAMDAGATTTQALPASYNGFVFVVDGDLSVGGDTIVAADQVAWLDRPASAGLTSVSLTAGPRGARFVIYAGEPQGAPIVSQGPFIADTRDDIVRLYQEFRAGRFTRLSELARETRERHEPTTPATISRT